MKIDIFPHIWPAKYKKALYQIAPYLKDSPFEQRPMLYEVDARFRVMDEYENLVQVLTLCAPAIEEIADPEKAVDLAKIANDEMAELITRYPDRFIAGVAALPMNNIDMALKEVDRAIVDLGFKGVQVFTWTDDKPLDSAEFLPLYEKMSKYDLPIWIHPNRSSSHGEFWRDDKSYGADGIFGWPFETSMTMTRLIFSGILEKWPNLKVITHHCGGMVPFYKRRIETLYDIPSKGQNYKSNITKAPIEYYKMFYNDTAIYGHTPGLMCGYDFFGADHLLFGTDMPLGDSHGGTTGTRETIESIERMDITDSEKNKIFKDNARELLRLQM